MITPQITLEQKKFILETLRRFFPGIRVTAFGSRVRGNAQAYSDLDLALDAGHPLPLSQWEALSVAFRESDLPFAVDLVDFHRVSEDFKTVLLDPRSTEVWS